VSGFTFAAAEGAGIDVAEASRASFEAVEAGLHAREAQFADIVRTRLLYSARADHPVMNQAREPLFRSVFADGDFPTSGGFVTGGRGDGSPRFGLEVVARSGKRTAFSPAVIRRWGGVAPPFVHVAEVAGVAFVSGQTAFETDGTFPLRGPGEQARKVLSTFAPILAEVGRTVANLLAITLFVAPEAAGDAFAGVRDALDELLSKVGDPPPVITCVGAEALVFNGAYVGAEAVAGAPGALRNVCRVEDPRAVALALGSTAARSGDLVVASVAVSEERGAAAIDVAAGALADAVAGVGGKVAPGALVTAFHAPPLTRDDIEELSGALQGTFPEVIVNPVPMRPARGVETLLLEAYASTS
jgi:enamine deaminase RidA (YjgF/YER057c/UK114 family)